MCSPKLSHAESVIEGKDVFATVARAGGQPIRRGRCNSPTVNQPNRQARWFAWFIEAWDLLSRQGLPSFFPLPASSHTISAPLASFICSSSFLRICLT